MIANVSLSDASFGETQNTLHWADRAKEIRTKVGSSFQSLICFRNEMSCYLIHYYFVDGCSSEDEYLILIIVRCTMS